MKIIFDEREHELYQKCSTLIQQQPTPQKYYQLEKKVLSIGDVIVQTDADEILLIVERKTFADLLASIKDGRYEEQSYRLLHSSGLRPHFIVYLLEGMFSTLKYPSDKKIIYSAITSLQFFKGFSVHKTATIQETGEWLLYMTEKIAKELAGGKQFAETRIQTPTHTPSSEAEYCSVVKKVKKENITPQNIGEIMLCQIPGISSVTAMAVMKHFEGGFPHFLDELKKNPACIENIMAETAGGKQRKISKACIENIKLYLLSSSPPPEDISGKMT